MEGNPGRTFPGADSKGLLDGGAIGAESSQSFPFDSQQFYVLVDLLLPEDLYQYGILEGFSGVGEHLGEEEWNVTGFDTAIGSQEYGSRFSFTFDADRNQGYSRDS